MQKQALLLGSGNIGCYTYLELLKMGWKVDMVDRLPFLRIIKISAGFKRKSAMSFCKDCIPKRIMIAPGSFCIAGNAGFVGVHKQLGEQGAKVGTKPSAPISRAEMAWAVPPCRQEKGVSLNFASTCIKASYMRIIRYISRPSTVFQKENTQTDENAGKPRKKRATDVTGFKRYEGPVTHKL